MPVNTSDLIGDVSEHIKIDFAGKETIYYYIDNSYGNISSAAFLDGYEYSYPHDSGAEKFIENVFQSIDGYIELDFQRTYSKSQGNIDIYYLGNFYEGIAGLTWSETPYDSNVEIFWEKQQEHSYIYGNYGLLKDRDAYTLIHEIGHALGLDHPNDDPYGNWHNSNDTVMSYNFIFDESLSYTQAPSWSSKDILALQIIWGIETGNTPTSISLSSQSFNENILGNTSIATLSTSDIDVNDRFTYTLVSGVGDTDNSSFTIEGSSLKINSSPDFEKKSSYSIRIKTTDSGNKHFEKSFTLSVNDVNENTTETNQNAATSRELQQLYIAYFSRPSDPAGLDYWTNEGISRSAFAANMYLQPEFNNLNGGLTLETQVNQIYLNLFNRKADITGLEYWTNQIQNGVLQLASIANDLIWAAENNPGGSNDASILTNKTNAAVAYTGQIRTSISSILAYQPQSTNPWITGNNLTEAKNFIVGIGKYNTHTTWSIQNSISKFSSVSSSISYKRLIDKSWRNKDIITGIETNIHASNTIEATYDEIDIYLSKASDNYSLLDINHQTFVSLLHEKVLDREADAFGMNNCLGQLNNGAQTRYEVLLGFSESADYKALFAEPTNFA